MSKWPSQSLHPFFRAPACLPFVITPFWPLQERHSIKGCWVNELSPLSFSDYCLWKLSVTLFSSVIPTSFARQNKTGINMKKYQVGGVYLKNIYWELNTEYSYWEHSHQSFTQGLVLSFSHQMIETRLP